jgi:hypothetical protein
MLLRELGTSPFNEGLIVVMDGMGETYKAMLEDIGGVEVRTEALMYTFDYCDCGCCEQQLVASTSPAT